MSFELRITKDFVEMTDALIESFRKKEAVNENSNVLIVKIPLVNTSTISIVEGKFQQDQVYQSGVGRVIATPRLANPERDAKAKPGDFVIFNHASKYTLSSLVVQWLLGVKLTENKPLDFVEEYNSFPVIVISDVDVITTIPPEKLINAL